MSLEENKEIAAPKEAEIEKAPVENNDEDNGIAAAEDETKDQNKNEKKEDDGDSIYSKPLQNQVSVARNHPLSYYVDRSRRILRKDETLIVKGRGTTISMACTLVEVLKRQSIAKINKTTTGMDIQSYFSARGETRWTQPAPVITFELTRGKFAKCVSDYHQRKVIEIFEKQETTKESGLLSYEILESLNLATSFKANDEQVAEGNEFLEGCKNENNPPALDLPNFIRYASILIHPLLRDREFKNILKESFSIDDDKRENDDDAEKNGDDDDMEDVE